MPASRSKPSIARCRQVTPQARMIVRARSTSPPSRCTWRVAGVDARDRPGDEDLGAEPPRLLQRAARQLVAGHAGREAEVVLDPRRRAGLAAGRLALDHDRAQPLRRAVHRGGQPRGPGADDRPCRTRRRPARCAGRAARRPGAAAAATTVLPSTTRIAGQSSSAGQRAAPLLGGVRRVGRDPPERDLVAVEEAPQLACRTASQRWPTTIARGGGGSAAMPCRPRARRSGRAPAAPSSWRRRRARGGDRVVVGRPRSRMTRDGSAARNPTGNTVPSAIGTSPKMSPGLALADDALDPVDELDRLDAALEHREQRALVALVRGVLARRQPDVRRDAGEPLALRLAQAGEQRDRRDLVRRHHDRHPLRPVADRTGRRYPVSGVPARSIPPGALRPRPPGRVMVVGACPSCPREQRPAPTGPGRSTSATAPAGCAPPCSARTTASSRRRASCSASPRPSASRRRSLTAGVAGLVAGALSMAAGEYVSVSSQRDTEQADLRREEHELASDPDGRAAGAGRDLRATRACRPRSRRRSR